MPISAEETEERADLLQAEASVGAALL
ncbi:unnamed protein product [Linum tenue]|uniref:Uncharacterized protein n=1 Tax=Linum tenue TaxID=586396 RepID=A0AAV0KWH6_9ROSI|nr:unnamed protein product [Linum tenue]